MNKLELTWIGKDKKIQVEPRILVENPELSNIKNDENTENMIIHGDNLLALKVLEKNYRGKIKCIYIDPPYNTGSAFKHYIDSFEHSMWLSLMKPRLEILRNLLSDDGSIWISIDADESHYLKVLCDEIYGRNNFIDEIIWQRAYSPINLKKTLSRSHDCILVYAKNKTAEFTLNRLPRSSEANSRYSNPDNDSRGVWKSSDLSVGPAVKSNIYEIITPSGRSVYPPKGYSWRLSKSRFEEFVKDNRIWFGESGNNVPSIKRFLSEVKDGIVAMTLWTRDEVGDSQEGKREIKSLELGAIFDTPKQERLIERILILATNENDFILDSFLGSGTTCAVAQKMNRKYIGIEIGDHIYTNCKVRLDKVIDGEQGGISIKKESFELENETLQQFDFPIEDLKKFNKILGTLGKETDLIPSDILKNIKKATKIVKNKKKVNWQGGGAYRFYELAPPLITKDFFNKEIINSEYNPEMLSISVALHEGYVYNPSNEFFWKQSKGIENSYLFVTTNYIDSNYVSKIKETMEENEFLLIACESFEESAKYLFKNIKIKKIPDILLKNNKIEKNNYNFKIITG